MAASKGPDAGFKPENIVRRTSSITGPIGLTNPYTILPFGGHALELPDDRSGEESQHDDDRQHLSEVAHLDDQSGHADSQTDGESEFDQDEQGQPHRGGLRSEAEDQEEEDEGDPREHRVDGGDQTLSSGKHSRGNCVLLISALLVSNEVPPVPSAPEKKVQHKIPT